MICHYCAETYEPSTSLERSFADDETAHNVCSGCLFDVITNGEEIDPLPRFEDAIDTEASR